MQEASLEISAKAGFVKKGYQKIAQGNINYFIGIYTKIFENYESNESCLIRNIIFLNTFINGFTLTPNTRNKKELTPWYVDNFVTPVCALIEKALLENPNFTIRALPLNYQKPVILYENDVIALDEPLKTASGDYIIGEVPKADLNVLLLPLTFSENKAELKEPKTKKAKEEFKPEVLGELFSETIKKLRMKKQKVKKEKTVDTEKNKRAPRAKAETPTLADNISIIESQALEIDLINFLRSEEEVKTEKFFLETYLRNQSRTQPLQPQQKISYETWRRGDRAYNLPWIKMKRKVFQETGLSFNKYNPQITAIERKIEGL